VEREKVRVKEIDEFISSLKAWWAGQL